VQSDYAGRQSVCPVDRVLCDVGDRWSLLILRDSFAGVKQFNVFQKNLGISRHILSNRLRRLTEKGLLKKEYMAGSMARSEYVLTAKAEDLMPCMEAITQCGMRWLEKGS
jgi:DNA-binding HxlR family transcriptional regulator